ncbi:MAG: 30S ribosomal protein S13 [archaeon]
MAIFENIVRVMNTDLNGDKSIAYALTSIKGVNYNLAKAIIYRAKIDGTKKLKDLSEKDISEIEKIIEDPIESKIPSWLLNRNKDYKTGENLHITGTDITITVREDINRLRKIRSYRGIRHEKGLPTRGQRTRSSFRKGAKVGVVKKKK